MQIIDKSDIEYDESSIQEYANQIHAERCSSHCKHTADGNWLNIARAEIRGKSWKG